MQPIQRPGFWESNPGHLSSSERNWPSRNVFTTRYFSLSSFYRTWRGNRLEKTDLISYNFSYHLMPRLQDSNPPQSVELHQIGTFDRCSAVWASALLDQLIDQYWLDLDEIIPISKFSWISWPDVSTSFYPHFFLGTSLGCWVYSIEKTSYLSAFPVSCTICCPLFLAVSPCN